MKRLIRFGWILLCIGLLPACSTVPATHASGTDETEAVQNDDGDWVSEDEYLDDSTANLPTISLSESILYRFLVSEMAINDRYFDLAAGQLISLARETNDPRLIRRAARVAVLAQDNQLLLQITTRWLEQSPDDVEARRLDIVAQLRVDNVDQALSDLESLASENDRAVPVNHYRWLTALLPQGAAMSAAEDMMDRYSKKHPEDVGMLFAYAHVASRLGHLDLALIATDQILVQHPELLDAAIMKVRVLQMEGKNVDAVRYLQGYVDRNPDATSARLMLARLLMTGNLLEEALTQFEELNRRKPGDEDVLFALAVINLQLERLEQGERYLRVLQAQGQREDDVAYYLGRIAELRGESDKAIQYYSQVGQGPNYPESRIRLALLLDQTGKVDEALAEVRGLREQLPSDARRLYIVEASILGDAGRKDDVLALYEDALRMFPHDPKLLYARAMYAEEIDRLDILEQDLKAIIATDPNNVNALNSLGYTLADRTDRYEEAYGYIKRAYDRDAHNNAILDSMGWVLFKLGRVEEGIPYLRKSMDLKADHEVAAHLGEALWVNGQQDEAVSAWDNGLKIFPNDPLILQVKKRFKPDAQ
ncbi:MAG: tetratricopeptide repeat protein [Gammaproteobacteria bacterium]|nr:tetratricopeptide repeat protein [Gammaproteobacteria bacterium]